MRFADIDGTTQDPKLIVEYTELNQAPFAPTALLTEEQTNPSGISDGTPEFSAIYSDPNSAGAAVHYRIHVSASASWSPLVWDSGQTAMATTSNGARSPDISYAGPALASSTAYYWRIKFWDDKGAESAWSAEVATFSLENAPSITHYEYDQQKNLTKITDVESNIRNFTYDALGRRLTAQDLHASGDGTYGTWYFAYDDAGNIASTTDPKSQNVVYAYDDINRPLSEDYSGTVAQDITFSYDTCDYGKGLLCGATTTAAGINYTYDPLGRPKTERHATSTSVFTTAYTRDRQGNLTDIAYPDGATVTYAYNSAGLLETVSKLEPGTTTAILIVADTDYGPTGAVVYRDFGNGTETIYTYDPNELYRLTNIRTTEHAPDESFGIGGLGLLALDEQAFLASIEDVVVTPEGSALPVITEDAAVPESETAAATTSDTTVAADTVVPASDNTETTGATPGSCQHRVRRTATCCRYYYSRSRIFHSVFG